MSNLIVQNKENWIAIKEQAEAVKKAGLLPAAMTSEQAAVIVLKGQELGIGTMRALEGLYVVNGKIGMSAALVMGLIRERCPQAKILVKRKDNKGCVIEATRPGQEMEVFQFLEADAKAAGLLKPNSPWEKYSSSMYWSRAVTSMGRQLFSDILGAPYSSEELGGDHHEEYRSEPPQPAIQAAVRPALVSHKEYRTDKPGDDSFYNMEDSVPNGAQMAQTKGASVSSLNDRLQPQASSLSVTSPPKASVSLEPIDVETGEVVPVPMFDSDEPLPEFKHWERIATSGVNSGKSLNQIFKEVGKDKFIDMFKTSVAKIAEMNRLGKAIPQNTLETFKDLESCCRELGVS